MGTVRGPAPAVVQRHGLVRSSSTRDRGGRHAMQSKCTEPGNAELIRLCSYNRTLVDPRAAMLRRASTWTDAGTHGAPVRPDHASVGWGSTSTPLQDGVGLEPRRDLRKYLGGQRRQRRRGRARHGRPVRGPSSGRPARIRSALRSSGAGALGVDEPVRGPRSRGLNTPVTFARSFRPTTSRCTSTATRSPRTSCWTTDATRPRRDPLREDLLGHRHRGLSREPSRFRAPHGRETPAAARPLTSSTSTTVPCFWESAEVRRAQGWAKALEPRTAAIGNREECEVRESSKTEPDRAATPCWSAVSSSPWSSRGPKGVLAQDRGRAGRSFAPHFVERDQRAAAAGDGFGGAVCHGLLAGWPIERELASPTPRAPSSPPAAMLDRHARPPPS
ncbi:hypothetical protein FQR65_LT20795 [Abscondita terminalis]|nr:hypothetical protein FQR65_LT20795 [Abscondita terminalis]